MRTFLVLGLTAYLFVQSPAVAKCCKQAIALTPIQQTVRADAVLIGEVIDLEPDMVKGTLYTGAEETDLVVAVIRVEERLHGQVGITHLRVAFSPMSGYRESEEFAENRRYWNGEANLKIGMTGCFFLEKNPKEDFYMTVRIGYAMEKRELRYGSQLDMVRKACKALDQPAAALRSKDAADRQLAACVLSARHGQVVANGGDVKNSGNDLPLAESKLVLKTLAEMKLGDLANENREYLLTKQGAWNSLSVPNVQWPDVGPQDDSASVLDNAMNQWIEKSQDSFRLKQSKISKSSN